MKIEEVVKRISELKTLVIPAIDDGMPYVRLDEVGDALSSLTDVSKIYAQVRRECSKYKPQTDNH